MPLGLVPLDPLFAPGDWPARGPAADEGVRPTIYADARPWCGVIVCPPA